MPHWPQTGCSVIVERDGKVLLIKRGKEPYKNFWSLPGGGQEPGETLEVCARRELQEETGLVAGELKFLSARDRKANNADGSLAFHFVILTFLASSATGEAAPLSDAADLGWFSFSEMEGLEATPDTIEFIKEIVGGKLA